MSDPCGCGGSNAAVRKKTAAEELAVLAEPVQCPATVHETVCVQADVLISPCVTVDTISTYCVGGPVIGTCPGTLTDVCTFSVSQNICVEIPLTFSACAEATPTGIVCGEPAIGPCL